MATVYDPKTKRYVDTSSAKTRPPKNYNFKLGINEFNKKYNTYRYSPEEFKTLSQYGYVGSFGGGALGFKAPAYAVKDALKDIRQGNTPNRFALPQDYFGSNIVDLASTPNPTAGEMGAWYNRAKDFNLADYIRQYGHAPSEESVYFQIFNPQKSIATSLEDRREGALEKYQEERDQSKRYTLLALARETKDPNIRALGETLPIWGQFTAGERKKADEVLRDFGLTGLGAATVPFDIGDKYMLPIDNTTTGDVAGGTSQNDAGRSIAEQAGIWSISPVSAILGQNETIRSLVSDPTSPLAPTPADQVNPISFIGNFLKGGARAGLGFPMGVAEMIANPVETTKNILKDYEYRYGSAWGNEDSQFIASTLEDPLAPIMDILGLVPIIGAGVKGAQIGKIAATTTRGQTIAERVNSTPAVQRAQSIIEEAERVGGPWAERGAGVREARARVAEATTRAIEEARAIAEAGGTVERAGLGAREFAALQRLALNNDIRGELAMGEMSSTGYFGLNSGYAPGAMDRAAAFFEPRWSYFSQADIMPEGVVQKAEVESVRKTLREAREGEDVDVSRAVEVMRGQAPIRFAGSPLARGAQKALFVTQKAIGRKAIDKDASTGVQGIANTVVNLPLIGFQYRYAKALNTDVNSVGSLVQRELMIHSFFEQMIDVDGKHGGGRLTEAEQLAIMSQVSGKLYSPNVLRSIMLRKIDDEGTDEGVRLMLEQESKRMESDEFLSEFVKASDEMTFETTERGKRLARARDYFRQKQDLISHEAGIELDTLSMAAQTRIYAPALAAFDLSPVSIARRLNESNRVVRVGTTRGGKAREKSAIERMAVFNPNIALFEFLRMFDMPFAANGQQLRARINGGEFDDLVDENGRPVSRAEMNEEYQGMLDEFSRAADVLEQDPVFRSVGGAPFFVVDSARKTIFGQDLYTGRVIRVKGDTNNATQVSSNIVASEPITLPAQVFQKRGKAGRNSWDNIEFYKTRKMGDEIIPDEFFSDQLMRGSLNLLMKLYPDARDFTDKIGTETYKGRETFSQDVNTGAIASSGFLDYHLKTQFAAHKTAIDRRFNNDIKMTLENSAIPISLANFNAAKGSYDALRTMKVFDDVHKAEKYAQNTDINGAVTPGEVVPMMLNGEQKYVVKLNFVDTSKLAMKEMRDKQLLNAEEWEKMFIQEITPEMLQNPNDIIFVVPKRLRSDLTTSYARSTSLAARVFSGSTDLFKLVALSLNPRFVSQQVAGGAVMMMLANPMAAGHIMARYLQYASRNMYRSVQRKRGREIDSSYINHGDDYDIIQNRFVRDFVENIYMEDINKSFITRTGDSMGKWGGRAAAAANAGYTLAFALEKNMRVAVARQAAMEFPGFKAFMDSPEVAEHAAAGIPEMGYKTISRFNAAFDLLSDISSPFYNPMFMREVRHTADMVSGNYRDFSKTERLVRDTLIPFYAWTRHSAMFTKRLVQERPLTANAVYNVGNYGYEQIFERGGLPDWLVESIPMPEWIINTLGLDPEKDNRIGTGSINPFGTTANVALLGGNTLLGQGLAQENAAFDFMNPFVKAAVEQQTGKSLLTGAPLPTRNAGLLGVSAEVVGGLPLSTIIQSAYQSDNELNALRGRSDPMDIFKDPNDPESKLSVPEEKLNTRFPLFTPTGLFNLVSPSRAYSLDPKQLGEALDREFEQRGLEYKKNETERKKGAWRTINALSKWRAKRDFINNVWMPEFAAQNPDVARRVQAQLQAEFPKIPESFPQSMVAEVLSGALSIPEASRKAEVADSSKPIRRAPRVRVVDPDPVSLAKLNSPREDVQYDRPAGTVNTDNSVTVDNRGYVAVNGRVAIDANGRRVRYLVDPSGQLVLDENNLPILITDEEAVRTNFWDQYNPGGSFGPVVPDEYYFEPWTIDRGEWSSGGSINPIKRGG